jgi:hypothetical protein
MKEKKNGTSTKKKKKKQKRASLAKKKIEWRDVQIAKAKRRFMKNEEGSLS